MIEFKEYREYRELLIGCGNARSKQVRPTGEDWHLLTTLDVDPNCGAHDIHDLESLPLPYPDETFDEIHAYSVLEHIGSQGDWRFFFAQWSDFWRLLKPNGIVCGLMPAPNSIWVWGDPGHTKFIPPNTFTFLDQAQYTEQVGKTAMTDYRHAYKADFSQVYGKVMNAEYCFMMQAIKPSRISI